ncbi:MAG TPA: ATP-binding protein [Anaeromyxobacteraceae bacterium]|nr:ATP-binding protein [Anaeromyxobacteraceae bacterium]
MEQVPDIRPKSVAIAREASVLVVDDDEHVRRSLRRVLRRTSCNFLEAPEAATALDILAREPVHVVVSDYRMPGMDGVEFLRLVKERYPAIQRVLLTGQADTAAIEEAVNRSEIFRFIWKPWDESHLILTIQDAIDRFWMTEENDRLQRLLTARQAELERLNRDLDAKLEARTEALRLAAHEWRTCFDAIADPLAIIRGGCEVVRANTGFARHAGVAASELPGLHCAEHAFGDLPCPREHLAGETERVVSFRNRAWLMRAFPFGSNAVVVVYKDVTQEREVTRRLFQAEKMSALGQLAGGVAHEINNPLGGILAFAQIMAQDARSAEDQESLRLISDAAMRAKRIVESLLRFSRVPKEHERGPVDLARVVDEALLILAPNLRDGRLTVVRDLQPARVVGNGNQLQQVVVNLIVNASQAVAGKGRVTVHTGSGGPGRAVVSVADDGAGVPPEIAERIFEPFFTTKPEGQGTGLGLSICYRIAEEHGGTIRLETPPGGGARFVVDLPAAPE